MIKNPRLFRSRIEGNTTVGAYYFDINGNEGFMCDRHMDINQRTADFLCQTLHFEKAANGTGTGWFNQSKFNLEQFCTTDIKLRKLFVVFLKIPALIQKTLFLFKYHQFIVKLLMN